MVLGLCRRVGAFELVAGGAWRGARLLIVGYHGISQDDEHEWDPELYMPPEQFAERLRLLRDGGYRVLPLAEALHRLYAKTLPPRSVALTFDDGYANFYTKACPLLAEFGFPATVYLTTYYCEDNRPVFDGVSSYLLWKGRGRRIAGEGLVEAGGTLDLRTAHGRAHAHFRLRESARRRGMTAAEKDALARELASRVDVDYAAIIERRILHLMRPDEVRALRPELVDVQLHTHRHRTPRHAERFGEEIERNRRAIQELTGAAEERAHFCYPSGMYDLAFLPWLRALRIRTATTCVPGIASPRSDPLLLPRLVDTSLLSPLEFEGWAAGIAELLPRRRHAPPEALSI